MPFDGTYYHDDPVLKIIDKVDELICDEEHWYQGPVGRTKPMRWADDSFCPVTALTQGCGFGCLGLSERPAYSYLMKALPSGYRSIPSFNNADERTFPEIKDLIARARDLRLADMIKEHQDG